MRRELRKIAKALAEQGFDAELTKTGHLRVYLDGIWVTTFAGSPSD